MIFNICISQASVSTYTDTPHLSCSRRGSTSYKVMLLNIKSSLTFPWTPRVNQLFCSPEYRERSKHSVRASVLFPVGVLTSKPHQLGHYIRNSWYSLIQLRPLCYIAHCLLFQMWAWAHPRLKPITEELLRWPDTAARPSELTLGCRLKWGVCEENL